MVGLMSLAHVEGACCEAHWSKVGVKKGVLEFRPTCHRRATSPSPDLQTQISSFWNKKSSSLPRSETVSFYKVFEVFK